MTMLVVVLAALLAYLVGEWSYTRRLAAFNAEMAERAMRLGPIIPDLWARTLLNRK